MSTSIKHLQLSIQINADKKKDTFKKEALKLHREQQKPLEAKALFVYNTFPHC